MAWTARAATRADRRPAFSLLRSVELMHRTGRRNGFNRRRASGNKWSSRPSADKKMVRASARRCDRALEIMFARPSRARRRAAPKVSCDLRLAGAAATAEILSFAPEVFGCREPRTRRHPAAAWRETCRPLAARRSYHAPRACTHAVCSVVRRAMTVADTNQAPAAAAAFARRRATSVALGGGGGDARLQHPHPLITAAAASAGLSTAARHAAPLLASPSPGGSALVREELEDPDGRAARSRRRARAACPRRAAARRALARQARAPPPTAAARPRRRTRPLRARAASRRRARTSAAAGVRRRARRLRGRRRCRDDRAGGAAAVGVCARARARAPPSDTRRRARAVHDAPRTQASRGARRDAARAARGATCTTPTTPTTPTAAAAARRGGARTTRAPTMAAAATPPTRWIRTLAVHGPRIVARLRRTRGARADAVGALLAHAQPPRRRPKRRPRRSARRLRRCAAPAAEAERATAEAVRSAEGAHVFGVGRAAARRRRCCRRRVRAL